MKTTLKTLSFVFALLLLFAAGCKKKENVAGNCRITKKMDNNGDTALVTYDAQGRVSTYGNDAANYVFTYSGLTASVAIAHVTNQISIHISLDADGKATFITWSDNSGIHTNYTYAFEYDADGHIVKSLQTLQESGQPDITYYKDSLIWTNGNLTAKYTYIHVNSNPYVLQWHTQSTYTGDENKIGYHIFRYIEEPISITSGWGQFYHLFGKGPKNLPAVTQYFDETGSLTYQYAYTFLLNSNGFVTEENMVRSISYPFSVDRKFEYECF